jgi:peptidoglycan hydrolase-like protein with peptidoglycan-binding domain
MKLVLGSRGEDVTHLQVVLNFLGGSAIPLVEDGILGQKTHARLIAYQKGAGLKPDGILGPLTAKALSARALARS